MESSDAEGYTSPKACSTRYQAGTTVAGRGTSSIWAEEGKTLDSQGSSITCSKAISKYANALDGGVVKPPAGRLHATKPPHIIAQGTSQKVGHDCVQGQAAIGFTDSHLTAQALQGLQNLETTHSGVSQLSLKHGGAPQAVRNFFGVFPTGCSDQACMGLSGVSG